MKVESAVTEPTIDLDPTELLGLSQVAKVSDQPATDGPSPLAKLLSKIGETAPTSDIRLKTDIRQVGTTAHNLPLYTFRYIGKDERYEGVMAQDVLKIMPKAVSVGEDGYYRVSYQMLGIEMRRLD